MDESDIFRGQGPVFVCACVCRCVCVCIQYPCVCVCVCVCESHTLTYLVYCRRLYIAVGNAGRQSARLKLAVRATCLFLTKAETREQAEMEGTGRKERGEKRG